MKKIDKIDMFLFLCIVLGCAVGLFTIVAQWIVGAEIALLKAIVMLLFFIPGCPLLASFASDVLAKIINNHKEKKNNKENSNEEG